MHIKCVSFALALVLTFTAPATRAAQDPPSLSIRIAVPERATIAVRDQHAHFDVVIENLSSQPQKIIDEWNSWGYFNLRLEFTLPTGEKKTMEKLARDWSKNFLTTTTLNPGEVAVWEVTLDDTIWTNLPTPKTGEAKITLQAIFTQKDDTPNVWHGELHSPTQTITFRNAH